MPYPVFIVEDDDNTRARLQRAVENHAELTVCYAEACLSGARRALESGITPKVALIDIGLPDGSGLELIHELTHRSKPVDCMVISVLGDKQHVMAALSAGATGYILKDSHIDQIADDILMLIQGGSPISPMIARHLLKHFKLSDLVPDDANENQSRAELTDRETEVLILISNGYKRKEIAVSLVITINTVGTHVNNIYRKLSVGSNIEAIQEAFRQGLL